jgi:hypothetical protein
MRYGGLSGCVLPCPNAAIPNGVLVMTANASPDHRAQQPIEIECEWPGCEFVAGFEKIIEMFRHPNTPANPAPDHKDNEEEMRSPCVHDGNAPVALILQSLLGAARCVGNA